MNLTLHGEAAMKEFGERLGRSLMGGACIELVGDVGAGKTTLTKGIAMGLDISETVQSPTFTINRTYEARDGLRLSHYDFYRLSDAGIMADELAESLEDPQTIIVVEWGEVVGTVLPEDTLRITIGSPTESDRTLSFAAGGPGSAAIMKGLS